MLPKLKHIPKPDPTSRHSGNSSLTTRYSSSYISGLFSLNSSLPLTSRGQVKEIVQELSLVRQNHDFSKISTIYKYSVVSNLKKEISLIGSIHCKTDQRTEKLKHQICEINGKIVDLKQDINNALSDEMVYRHMINRMEREEGSFVKKTAEIRETVKSTDVCLNERYRKLRTLVNRNFAVKNTIKTIERAIDTELKDRKKDLKSIESHLSEKEENLKKTGLRTKRRIEITEKAANEEREKVSVNQKEKVQLAKLVCFLLHKKISVLMNDNSHIEGAFKRIRGLSSLPIEQLANNFLLREQMYTEKVKSTIEAREKVRVSLYRIEELQNRINTLHAQETTIPHTLIHDYRTKLNCTEKLKQKLDSIKPVHDHIKNWLDKGLRVLNEHSLQNTLLEKASRIKAKIVHLLTNYNE